MKWGSFGIVHISSLLLGVGALIGLYYLLKRFSTKTQITVLGIMSLFGYVSIVWNIVTWGSPYEYLPLHLCALSAMALPFAVFTRSKVLSNLLLLWSLGAVLALVVNTAQAEYEILSSTFFFYYTHHMLEFGIPILLFKLGLVKKDVKCIASTIGITLAIYTVIHFINLGLNDFCAANQIMNPSGELVQVNYMYSLYPENPVLALCWQLVPYEYWYMMPVIAIISVYLVFVYLKQIIALFKKKAPVQA